MSFACLAVLVAAAAGAAQAQQVDLSATLAGPTKLASYGETAKYKVTIHNAGPSHAHGVVLAASLPTLAGFAPAASGQVTVDSISSAQRRADGAPAWTKAACVSTTADVLPCTIGDIADLESVEIVFKVALPVPDPLPLGAAACPDPAVSAGDVAIEVTTTSPDTDTANNAATATLHVEKYADIAVAMKGPATASQGESVSYEVTVTNLGPCPSENVAIDFSGSPGLAIQSASGACTGFPLSGGVPECVLAAPLAAGASATFTTAQTVAGLPSDLLGTIPLPNAFDISADTCDPNASNNSAAVTTKVDTGNSVGCASAGAGGLLALLPLAFLAMRRRRTA